MHIRGAYIGLDLKHGQPELIRAAMEGVALNLRLRLDLLRKYTRLEDEILFVGGGARSRFYLGIFADVFNTRILKTNIDQDAGALGAAALAAVGCGLWKDFSRIDEIHKVVERVEPEAGKQPQIRAVDPGVRAGKRVFSGGQRGAAPGRAVAISDNQRDAIPRPVQSGY